MTERIPARQLLHPVDFLALGFNRRNILVIITMLPNKLMAVYANRIMGTELDEALQPAI